MRPTAVIPRANDQVIHVLSVILFEIRVGGHGPIKIFLVPPAGHIQIRHRRLMQGVRQRFLLPVFVIGRMLDKTVPRRNFAVQVIFVDVRKRPDVQIPVV